MPYVLDHYSTQQGVNKSTAVRVDVHCYTEDYAKVSYRKKLWNGGTNHRTSFRLVSVLEWLPWNSLRWTR